MKIINKIVDNGTIIGYTVDDDGLIADLLSRCLYNEMYITGLIEAGYKYYNYNPDEIETPNGKQISTLPEKGKEDIDEDMMFALQDLAAQALTDSDCSKYYSYHNDSIVEFKQPEESEIRIHTREELIDYIAGIRQMDSSAGCCPDNVPLNSFVAHDALFTVDEILKNDEIRTMFMTLSKRHKFRDWAGYQDCVDWLCKKGVLNTHTPTYYEFLGAYNSWGIDGIKSDCVKINSTQADDTSFISYTPGPNSNNYLYNRDDKMILLDEKENAYFLGYKVDMSEIQTFGREPIVLPGTDALFDMRRNAEPWNARYRVMRGLVADISDRINYDYLSEESYPYHVRVTHNEITLFNHHSVLVDTENFSIKSIVSGIYFTLDNITTQDDYMLWNAAVVKAMDIFKDRNVPAPVGSTYELLLSDGVNPKAAIMHIIHDLTYNTMYQSTVSYKDSTGKRPNYFGAFEDYCNPVPDEILEKFDITDDSYTTMDEFIDMANVTDEMIAGKAGKKSKEEAIMKLASGEQDEINPVPYYDKISFVRDCLNGEVVINAFGDGKINDGVTTVLATVEVLITAVTAYTGGSRSLNERLDALTNIADYGIINIDKVFRKRDAAYKGYLLDLAELRRMRAGAAWAWLYCTRVYRELSNEPIEKQRPYLMEVILVEDKNLRAAMTNCVKKSKPEGLDTFKNNIMDLSAPYLASQLFFFILAGKVNEDMRQGSAYFVPMNIPGIGNIDVKIDTFIYDTVRAYDLDANRRFITVMDYCKYEYGDNGAYSLYMVNADITPWSVVPKKGFSIGTYNFAVNYSPMDVFQVMGEDYQNAIVQAKAKPMDAIGRVPNTMFIPDVVPEIDGDVGDYTDDTIDTVLSPTVRETIGTYRKRWFSNRKRARAAGLKLLTIPLKQDIHWHEIARYFCEDVPSVDNVYSDELADDGLCLQTIDKGMLYHVEQTAPALAYTGVKHRKLDIKEFSYEEVLSMEQLLRGGFKPSVTIYMHDRFLSVMNGEDSSVIPYTELTQSSLESLAASGAILQLNATTYYVKAFNGNFVLEV